MRQRGRKQHWRKELTEKLLFFVCSYCTAVIVTELVIAMITGVAIIIEVVRGMIAGVVIRTEETVGRSN